MLKPRPCPGALFKSSVRYSKASAEQIKLIIIQLWITLIQLEQGTGKLCDISLLEHWECSETNANFKFTTTKKKLKMRLNSRRISMIEGSEQMQGGF